MEEKEYKKKFQEMTNQNLTDQINERSKVAEMNIT